jgi:hypothetical protein
VAVIALLAAALLLVVRPQLAARERQIETGGSFAGFPNIRHTTIYQPINFCHVGAVHYGPHFHQLQPGR